jgi:hypothetical protein
MSQLTIPITIPDHELQAPNYRPVSLPDPDRVEYRWSGARGPVYGTADAWALRKDFLECPPEKWREFLDRTGYFADRTTEKDFTETQLLLKDALLTAPKKWHSLKKKFDPERVDLLLSQVAIRFDWDGKIPTAKLGKSSALGLIIASIQLDALKGAQFRLCARQDCKSAPFKLGWRHDRIYCSPACAHLMAVRASRERERSEKVKKAAKKGKAWHSKNAVRNGTHTSSLTVRGFARASKQATGEKPRPEKKN